MGTRKVLIMKRKILKLAGTTQGITLPRSWVLFNDVKSGEEVNVGEYGNLLLIDTNNDKKQLEIEEYKNLLLIDTHKEDNSEVEIDLTNSSRDLMWRYLISAYRKGTKKVIITFKDKKELKIIQHLVKDLLGMAITKQHNNQLIMEDMFNNDQDIDSSLKKIFTLLIDLAKDSHEAIKKDDKLSLENIPYQDFNINKFTNLSIRLLNIHGYSDRDKTNSLYKIIKALIRKQL